MYVRLLLNLYSNNLFHDLFTWFKYMIYLNLYSPLRHFPGELLISFLVRCISTDIVDEDEFTAILTLLEGDDDEDEDVSPKEVGHNIYILAHEARFYCLALFSKFTFVYSLFSYSLNIALRS